MSSSANESTLYFPTHKDRKWFKCDVHRNQCRGLANDILNSVPKGENAGITSMAVALAFKNWATANTLKDDHQQPNHSNLTAPIGATSGGIQHGADTDGSGSFESVNQKRRRLGLPAAGEDDPQRRGRDGKFDLISAMASRIEVAVEVGKYLSATDLFHLYQVSRIFHAAINSNLYSSVLKWADSVAPEAAKIFYFRMYSKHNILIPDPAGRTNAYSNANIDPSSDHGQQIRPVPSMRWLQFVVKREQYVREILAIMARYGHRFPQGMTGTLMKTWLLMELPTTKARFSWLRNRSFWTDFDVYKLQMFVIKLSLLFNDPIYGPQSHGMLHLMMGQKGLFKLWQLLFRHKYGDMPSFLDLKLRYDFVPGAQIWGALVNEPPEAWKFYGIPISELGKGHLEGWGCGVLHLARPDELIGHIAVERELYLEKHTLHFVLWGYFDWASGNNLVPDEEEMFIQNEQEKLSRVDTIGMWKTKHAKKRRWETLTREEKVEIFLQEEDDKLRALEWAEECVGLPEGDELWDRRDESFSTADLEAEIDRGYVMHSDPTLATLKKHLEGNGTLQEYADRVLFGGNPTIVLDKVLRVQSSENFNPEDFSGVDFEAFLADGANIFVEYPEEADLVEEEPTAGPFAAASQSGENIHLLAGDEDERMYNAEYDEDEVDNEDYSDDNGETEDESMGTTDEESDD